MKGGGGGNSTSNSLSVPVPSKRRWKGLVIGVLILVLLSMLVPLVFLLGLHNGFHYVTGYESAKRYSASDRVYDRHNSSNAEDQSEEHRPKIITSTVRSLAPTLPKSFGKTSAKEGENSTQSGLRSSVSKLAKPSQAVKMVPVTHSEDETIEMMKGVDDGEMICEFKFGSYCFWRREHKERMDDTIVKRMKDLLFVARAYYPSIMKLPSHDKLSQELKQNIHDFEHLLSETATDSDISFQYGAKLTKMTNVIARAKSCTVDCNNVDKKFRQLVDLTEDEANFHTRQSSFLHQLAVQTMPKSLHCLSMRLTVEYFRSSLENEQTLNSKFEDPELNHYVIFSKNVLAASVVINSTVLQAKESEKLVFHLLTDRENYFAFKLWFLENKYRESAVQVLNIEDPDLYDYHNRVQLDMSLPEEFLVSFHGVDSLSSSQIITEYLSMFSHSHYLLPEVFKKLSKVVVLDDDIVVQRDLSFLWTIDMEEKVNGALQFCRVKLVQLKNYLSRSNIYQNSCAWTSGLNIINLSRWRELNLTDTFLNLVDEMNRKKGVSEATTLSASLLTFEHLVYALDSSWILSGLGYKYGVDLKYLEAAPVLHFDGSMKPWLELGIPNYKRYWKKFLNQESPFLNDCNLNP